MKQVVEFLLANETMTGKQCADCMEDRPITEDSKASFFDSPTEE